VKFVRVVPRTFKCGCPFNVVPEGCDAEGWPRMGKWYAFLCLVGGLEVG